jgi:nicotinamide-nucleotide amidase
MIEQKIISNAINKKLSMATIESLTGGMVSSLLTSVPGASQVFKGSLVSYQDIVKTLILGLNETELKKVGVVSSQTAKNMAENGLTFFGVDICLATTGIAGPVTVEGKPVGLVFIAVATKKETIFKELHLKGNRSMIRRKASLEVLKLVYEMIIKS